MTGYFNQFYDVDEGAQNGHQAKIQGIYMHNGASGWM